MIVGTVTASKNDTEVSCVPKTIAHFLFRSKDLIIIPVDNLHTILTCLLKGLMDERELLSPSIQGGKMYTQLSIRFEADDMAKSTLEPIIKTNYLSQGSCGTERDQQLTGKL